MSHRQESGHLEQTLAEIEVLANEAKALSDAFLEIRKRIVREDLADETVKLLGRWAATFAGAVGVTAKDATKVISAAREGRLWPPHLREPERDS